MSTGQHEPAWGDAQIIREAAILAGLIKAGQYLSEWDESKITIIFREMLAETETMRLARAVAASYGLPLPWPSSAPVVDTVAINGPNAIGGDLSEWTVEIETGETVDLTRHPRQPAPAEVKK